nr:FAD-binding oxidoreductase [Saprospiraceae bacterium]
MSKSFHNLTVKQVTRETADTVTLSFDVPADLADQYKFVQGQYLTLRFNIGGNEERRSYSMCSSPLESGLSVTVKKVKGGKVSNHVHDRVKAGDTVEVMTPDGRFFTELHDENKKNYYLVGAGSGITPLMSILKTILETEPMSFVFLLYGSRSEEEIIFKKQL